MQVLCRSIAAAAISNQSPLLLSALPSLANPITAAFLSRAAASLQFQSTANAKPRSCLNPCCQSICRFCSSPLPSSYRCNFSTDSVATDPVLSYARRRLFSPSPCSASSAVCPRSLSPNPVRRCSAPPTQASSLCSLSASLYFEDEKKRN